mmetsp:Transcript_49768/g.67733  ORF Transcript_49768/g.67733 Transcript_49768/m.67733 type:complete len:143 (-) Transcript_49768:108-536(-)
MGLGMSASSTPAAHYLILHFALPVPPRFFIMDVAIETTRYTTRSASKLTTTFHHFHMEGDKLPYVRACIIACTECQACPHRMSASLIKEVGKREDLQGLEPQISRPGENKGLQMFRKECSSVSYFVLFSSDVTNKAPPSRKM